MNVRSICSKNISLRILKERGKKHKSIVPCALTFLNALCGFLSIVKSLEGEWRCAAYCIFIAVILDAADGAVARFFDSTSGFGMELDSLCDAISFCLAPAVLLYGWRFVYWGTLGIAALGFFVCAGLYRLARFNVLHYQKLSYFTGLPTTVAAFLCASLVFHHAHLPYISFAFCPPVLSILVVSLGILMVSTMRFSSCKQRACLTLSARVARYVLVTSFLISVIYGSLFAFFVALLYVGLGLLDYCRKLAARFLPLQ